MGEPEMTIWRKAALEYGLDDIPFTKLGSFESDIWEVRQKGIPAILRITSKDHRSIQELRSEAEWMRFLYKNGVPVADCISTLSGLDCISIDDPPCYLMLFTKVPGHEPGNSDWNEALFEQWGSLLGRMHRLAVQFVPSKSFIRSFTENIFSSQWNRVGTMVDPEITKQYRSILKQIMDFPVSREHFGLIHSDAHPGNFFVDNGKITLFDFDDLQYGWFMFDIAMALYYSFWNADLKEETWYQNSNERAETSILILQHLIKGYKKEFPLCKEWKEMLPVFLYIRQLQLYFVFVDRFGHVTDPTSMPYILTNQYKVRLLNHVPPIPLQVFSQFS